MLVVKNSNQVGICFSWLLPHSEIVFLEGCILKLMWYCPGHLIKLPCLWYRRVFFFFFFAIPTSVKWADWMFFSDSFYCKKHSAEFERNICIEYDYILPLKHVLWAVLLCKYQTFPRGTLNVCVYGEEMRNTTGRTVVHLRNKKIFVCSGSLFKSRKTSCGWMKSKLYRKLNYKRDQ